MKNLTEQRILLNEWSYWTNDYTELSFSEKINANFEKKNLIFFWTIEKTNEIGRSQTMNEQNK